MKYRHVTTLPEFKSKETIVETDWYSEYRIPVYSGSQAPSPIVVGNKLYIYFSARDVYNRTFPFLYIVNDNLEVEEVKGPLARLGQPGTFDADGFMISQVMSDFFGSFCNYTGWNRVDFNSEVRYRTAVTQAPLSFNEDKGFINSKGPMIDRTSTSPCGTSMLVCKNDLKYMMSYTNWTKGEPVYKLSFAVSNSKERIIPNQLEDKCYARPVIREELFSIMYSIRDIFNYRRNKEKSYRLEIGYLSQLGYKGISSTEPVEIKDDLSPLMYAYGYPIKFANRDLLLYNTDFRSPISIAELV